MMKRNKNFLKLIGALLALFLVSGSLVGIKSNYITEADAYNVATLPTTIDLNAPAESSIRSYYSNAAGKNKNNLLIELKKILSNGQKYYGYDTGGDNIWKLYEIVDRDWDKSPASSIQHGTYNSNTNIITNYTYGTSGDNPYIRALYVDRSFDNIFKAFGNHDQKYGGHNREHVWPKSLGFDTTGEGGARGDPMHLWPGDGKTNNLHSNYVYGYVDKDKSYSVPNGIDYAKNNFLGISKTKGSGTVFEPQDSDKGDIARSIFYMAARYNYLAKDGDTISTNNPNLELVNYIPSGGSSTSTQSTTGKMGILSDLLEWNRLDPVDEFEIKRNNLLYVNYTNNRNPFIDFPQWADIIWGSESGTANPSTDPISKKDVDPVPVTGVSLDKEQISVSVEGKQTLVATVSPLNATNKSVTWKSSNSSIATVSNGVVTGVSEGTCTITVTTNDGGFEKTCSVTVTKKIDPTGQEYKLSFKTNTSDGSTDLTTSTISGQITENTLSNSFTTLTKIYSGKSGIKMGSSKASGTISFNLKDDAKQSTFKLEIKSIKYETEACTVTTKINGKSVGTFSAGDTFSYVYSEASPGTSISLESNKRVYISEIKLTVEGQQDVPVTGVSLNKTSLTMDVHDEELLEAIIAPANATNKGVSWETSDDSVIEVIEGNVRACGAGNATVTVVTEDGSFTATCSVTVNKPALASLNLLGNYSTLFFQNQSFTSKGLIVQAVYSDGSTQIVEGDIVPPDMTTVGKKEVTVSYGGKNTSYFIDVIERSGAFYKVASYSRVDVSNAPENSVATFANTNHSKGAITATNNALLTLSGYTGNRINNIYLSMKSNQSNGEGYLIAKRGNTQIASIGSSSLPLPFNDEAWFGSYIDEYVNLKLDLTNLDEPIKENENITIQIFATVNSLYIESYTVDYTEVPDLVSISLSNIQSIYNKGETFVKPTVTAHYEDDSTNDVTNGTVFTGNDTSTLGGKTVTASYTEFGITCSTTFDIVVQENSGSSNKYELVTSADSLSSGDKITFIGYIASGDNKGYYAITPYAGGNNCGVVSVADPVENIITSSSISPLTLGKESDNNYTFYDGTYYLYAAGGSSNNHLKGADNSDNLNSHWSISINNENKAEITALDTNVTRNLLKFNASNKCFSAYGSSSGGVSLVWIYKQKAGEPSNLQKAQQFAVNLNNSIVCYSGVKTPIITGTSWYELSVAYNQLSTEVKAIFVNATYSLDGTIVTPLDDTDQCIANCVAKYDQLVVRYSTTYSDFMDRNPNLGRNPIVSPLSNVTSQTMLIVAASVIGLSVVAGYIFYRRRKEQ